MKKCYFIQTNKVLFYLMLFFCCLSLTKSLVAQSNSTIAIPLIRVIGSGPLYKMTKSIYQEVNCPSCIGIPSNSEQFAIFTIGLNSKQALFDKFRASVVLNVFEQAFLETIDTTQLSKISIHHSIKVYSGICQGKKIIIFDTNNNDDFSDDMLYKFPLILPIEKEVEEHILKPTVLLNYEMLNPATKNIGKRDVVARFYPYSSTDNPLSFDLISFEHRLGTFNIKDSTYHIALMPKGGFNDDFSNVEIAIKTSGKRFVSEADKSKIRAITKELGDVVKLRDDKYILEKVSIMGDTIFLRKMDEKVKPTTDKNSSSRPIMPFVTEDLNGKKIDSENYSDKYVLLNFWGTWCGPCMKKIPFLNRLSEKADSKNLVIIGIAKDSDQEQLKKVIKDQNIAWINIFEHLADLSEQSLTNLFEVTSFPTMILYFPNNGGQIRASSVEELQHLENYLLNLD